MRLVVGDEPCLDAVGQLLVEGREAGAVGGLREVDRELPDPAEPRTVGPPPGGQGEAAERLPTDEHRRRGRILEVAAGHQEARLGAPEGVERVRQQLGSEVPVDARDGHGRVGPAEVHRGPRSQAQLAGRLLGDPRPAGRTPAAQARHVVERPGPADEADPGGHLAVGGDGRRRRREGDDRRADRRFRCRRLSHGPVEPLGDGGLVEGGTDGARATGVHLRGLRRVRGRGHEQGGCRSRRTQDRAPAEDPTDHRGVAPDRGPGPSSRAPSAAGSSSRREQPDRGAGPGEGRRHGLAGPLRPASRMRCTSAGSAASSVCRARIGASSSTTASAVSFLSGPYWV